jgi:hypothetical protein
MFEKCRLVLDAPHEVDAGAVIDAPATLAGVDGDPAAILRPIQDQLEHLPRIVGLPLRCQRKLVAPFEEDAAGARIGQRLERSVAEFLFCARGVVV